MWRLLLLVDETTHCPDCSCRAVGDTGWPETSKNPSRFKKRPKQGLMQSKKKITHLHVICMMRLHLWYGSSPPRLASVGLCQFELSAPSIHSLAGSSCKQRQLPTATHSFLFTLTWHGNKASHQPLKHMHIIQSTPVPVPFLLFILFSPPKYLKHLSEFISSFPSIARLLARVSWVLASFLLLYFDWHTKKLPWITSGILVEAGAVLPRLPACSFLCCRHRQHRSFRHQTGITTAQGSRCSSYLLYRRWRSIATRRTEPFRKERFRR